MNGLPARIREGAVPALGVPAVPGPASRPRANRIDACLVASLCVDSSAMKARILFRPGIVLFLASSAVPAADTGRPGLFFREDFRETPPETPATQADIANPDLILSLYGPGKEGIKKSHHDKPADDPYYIWTGTCAGTCVLTLRHRSSLADLTGKAKLRWRTMQSGFRLLRIVLKLADGTWLVSDQYDDASDDWRVREFNLSDIRWRRLEIKGVTEGAWERAPDLSRVDEIGFTDLMAGGGSAACSRVDWIEVYGRPVER